MRGLTAKMIIRFASITGHGTDVDGVFGGGQTNGGKPPGLALNGMGAGDKGPKRGKRTEKRSHDP